jgi:hypothetical protein
MKTSFHKPTRGLGCLRRANRSWAFTRVEALAVLAGIIGLVGLVLPALASDRSRSSRIHCANNLRQLWVALQLWGGDHGDQLLWNASMTDGGTRLHPLSANAWLHYAYLSNELASPKILLCPSDTGTPARDFSGHPESGYLHSNFRNRATSYFLNAHPNGSILGTFAVTSLAPLLGDRNIPTEGTGQCSVMTVTSLIRLSPVSANFGWKSGLHGPDAGNVLFYDGQVQHFNDAQLRNSMEAGDLDSGAGFPVGHFSLPR